MVEAITYDINRINTQQYNVVLKQQEYCRIKSIQGGEAVFVNGYTIMVTVTDILVDCILILESIKGETQITIRRHRPAPVVKKFSYTLEKLNDLSYKVEVDSSLPWVILDREDNQHMSIEQKNNILNITFENIEDVNNNQLLIANQLHDVLEISFNNS